MQAYCMKCRTKREMKDAKAITMKNGKPATQGTCPNCGTRCLESARARSTLVVFRNRYRLGCPGYEDSQPFFFSMGHISSECAANMGRSRLLPILMLVQCQQNLRLVIILLSCYCD